MENRFRIGLRALLLAVMSVTLLAACGGGGGGGSTTGGSGGTSGTGGSTTTAVISSFLAGDSTIAAGMSTTLTGYFSGGNGSVDNGVGAVSNGVAVPVTPVTTTSYTLTVTDSTGLSATKSTTVTVVPPIVLQIGTAALPYTGTIGTNASGYYQITGMTQGHRYAISINATNYPAITYYSDAAYTQPVKCDPNTSTSACIIEAPGTSLWVRIQTSYFNSSDVTIDAVHVSAPTEFEGTWKSPVVLDYSVAGNLPHVGKVDKYNSYYSIQGLTIGKQYTIWLQSMTDDARLGTLDPVTRTWVGGLCNPDKTWVIGFQYPESCTWVATDTKFEIGVSNTSLSANLAYILRVEEALSSEGSMATPVAMAYAGNKVSVAGRVAAAGTSYYHVSGLSMGTDYLVSIAGIARHLQPGTYDPPTIQPYGADASYSTTSACTATAAVAGTYQCTVTAAGSDLYFTVVGPAQYSGMTYNLTISPVPLTDGNPTAVSLTTASLPYNGQVNEQFVPPGTDYLYSNYTITGLSPNTFYQVFLKNLTGVASLAAWATSSSVIDCGTSSDTTATCALSSGTNGAINVRTGAISNASNQYVGALYTLDVKPAFQLAATTTYTDNSGPIAIPDPGPGNNPVTPVLVPITVTGSSVTSISDVTVEFFITHGIASQLTINLIAPDGTVVPLVAPNTVSSGSSGFLGTQLNDYAPERLDGASGGVETPSGPFYGVYRARLPLHVLRGMDANGTWTLSILDDQYTNISGQTGEYRAWGISFK